MFNAEMIAGIDDDDDEGSIGRVRYLEWMLSNSESMDMPNILSRIQRRPPGATHTSALAAGSKAEAKIDKVKNNALDERVEHCRLSYRYR